MEFKIQITCECTHNQFFLINTHKNDYKCNKCGKILFKLHVIKGYIYILSNPAMPGLLKIGYTEKEVQQRIDELNSTGIPTPFEIEAIFESNNPFKDEQKIHNYFSNNRYSKNREFFSIEIEQALNKIIEILSITPLFTKNYNEKYYNIQLQDKKKELMNEFSLTEEKINEIESKISDDDKLFYKDLSAYEILRKKIWEYKNW